MPLVNPASPPQTSVQRIAFDFSHYNDHLEIAQAIQRQTGVQVPVLPINPAGDQTAQWKRLHQTMHDAMNQALKLPQGRDLTGEIDDDWHNDNWREHAAARAKLGI